jgi:hypothetical protein
MTATRILSIALFVVALGLAYFLFDSIKYKIDEEERIAKIEERIVEKLKMIRDAEVAYASVNGRYTSDWDKLLAFVDTGKLYNILRKERIIMLSYGADSTVVTYDTLGTVSVRDSIFNEQRYPNFNLETLPLIPGGEGERFELFADQITKGTGAKVNVFEAKDVVVVNPMRRAENSVGPLRVGSRTEATTQGNWE